MADYPDSGVCGGRRDDPRPGSLDRSPGARARPRGPRPSCSTYWRHHAFITNRIEPALARRCRAPPTRNRGARHPRPQRPSAGALPLGALQRQQAPGPSSPRWRTTSPAGHCCSAQTIRPPAQPGPSAAGCSRCPGGSPAPPAVPRFTYPRAGPGKATSSRPSAASARSHSPSEPTTQHPSRPRHRRRFRLPRDDRQRQPHGLERRLNSRRASHRPAEDTSTRPRPRPERHQPANADKSVDVGAGSALACRRSGPSIGSLCRRRSSRGAGPKSGCPRRAGRRRRASGCGGTAARALSGWRGLRIDDLAVSRARMTSSIPGKESLPLCRVALSDSDRPAGGLAVATPSRRRRDSRATTTASRSSSRTAATISGRCNADAAWTVASGGVAATTPAPAEAETSRLRGRGRRGLGGARRAPEAPARAGTARGAPGPPSCAASRRPVCTRRSASHPAAPRRRRSSGSACRRCRTAPRSADGPPRSRDPRHGRSSWTALRCTNVTVVGVALAWAVATGAATTASGRAASVSRCNHARQARERPSVPTPSRPGALRRVHS